MKSSAAALSLLFVGTQLHATPYASSLTNDSGVISFRLNEAADDVKVISDGGATTNELGALPAGLTTTNLGVTGTYYVQVFKQGDCAINTNSPVVPFNSPRGVAVNTHPDSPYFGRVYVANTAAGTKGDGIYVYNADGTPALGVDTNFTAGLDFATGGSSSPFRVAISDDDELYITDWSDATGNLYVTDPDLTTSWFALQPLDGTAAVPVGSTNNHGSITGVAVAGSTNTGDLVIYTVDEDLGSDRDVASSEQNSLWQYPVGSGPLPSSVFDPTNKLVTPVIDFVSQTMDLTRGPNGYLYMTQRRSDGLQPILYIVDPNLGIITNSLQLSTNIGSSFDLLREGGGVTVSPDGKFLATIRYADNIVTVVPLVDGIPDLSRLIQYTGFGTTAAGRGIAFDSAYNLYVISSGLGLFQSLSLGITATATTGSDGTFEIDAPLVSIAATDAEANENGPDTGSFTISREGSTASPLVLDLAISGLASNGVDYAAIPTTITLLSGQSSTNILITPVDDSFSEPNETVSISFDCGTNYSVVSQPSATVTIIDNDQPLVTIAAVATNMYERLTEDYVVFSLTRGGDVDNSSLSVQIEYSGTASNFVDFNGVNFPFFNTGESTIMFTNYPFDDAEIEGSETVTAYIVPDPNYIVGSPSNATAYITDDELGAEAVSFSDDFDTDTSANWTKTSGAADGVEDDIVNFNYDYSIYGIPAAPGGFTTTGLRVSVNKQDTNAVQAGVNLYPNGVSLSNNYALRFQMFIEGVDGAGTTEAVLFGLNHSGTRTNWHIRSTSGTGFSAATPGGGDGVWFNVGEDSNGFPGGADYGAFDTTTAPPVVLASSTYVPFESIFKAPPFRFGGSPASFSATLRQSWVDVEVRQINGQITLLLNNIEILKFANPTAYTSGNFMLGYNDAFGSIGGGSDNTIASSGDIFSGYVVFDNVRVVNLTLLITNIAIVGGNVEIDFVANTTDLATDFDLYSAGNVDGPYTMDGSASISSLGSGNFRATTPLNGDANYYRVVKP